MGTRTSPVEVEARGLVVYDSSRLAERGSWKPMPYKIQRNCSHEPTPYEWIYVKCVRLRFLNWSVENVTMPFPTLGLWW